MNSQEWVVLNVNGIRYECQADVTESLASVLREKLGLIGTKIMCNEGECGACTVLMNGEPKLSCMTLAVDAQDQEILTIEGMADRNTGELHPIQQAFVDHGGLQCGVCTPGMIMTSKALLDRNPDPSEEDVRKSLSGNLCRCGTYRKITESVLGAAKVLRGGKSDV